MRQHPALQVGWVCEVVALDNRAGTFIIEWPDGTRTKHGQYPPSTELADPKSATRDLGNKP